MDKYRLLLVSVVLYVSVSTLEGSLQARLDKQRRSVAKDSVSSFAADIPEMTSSGTSATEARAVPSFEKAIAFDMSRPRVLPLVAMMALEGRVILQQLLNSKRAGAGIAVFVGGSVPRDSVGYSLKSGRHAVIFTGGETDMVSSADIYSLLREPVGISAVSTTGTTSRQQSSADIQWTTVTVGDRQCQYAANPYHRKPLVVVVQGCLEHLPSTASAIVAAGLNESSSAERSRRDHPVFFTALTQAGSTTSHFTQTAMGLLETLQNQTRAALRTGVVQLQFNPAQLGRGTVLGMFSGLQNAGYDVYPGVVSALDNVNCGKPSQEAEALVRSRGYHAYLSSLDCIDKYMRYFHGGKQWAELTGVCRGCLAQHY